MTPILASKAKEIAVKYNNWVEETYLKGEETGLWFTYRHYANEENGITDDELYSLWLATPQAAALLSGEDWKEDVTEWEYTSFESETPLFSFEISKKVEAGKGWELCGIVSRPLDYIYYFKKPKRPLPEPPKP